MIYLNMGHGDEEFIDATQNLLFVNAFRWVVSTDKQGDPFKNRPLKQNQFINLISIFCMNENMKFFRSSPSYGLFEQQSSCLC